MAAVPTVLTGSDQAIYTPPAGVNGVGTLYGWSIRSGGACSVNICSGTVAGGPIIGAIELPGAGTSSVWFGYGGVQAKGGIFVDVLVGTPAGVVYTG